MSEDHADDTEKKSHADADPFGGDDDVGEIVNGGTLNGRRGGKDYEEEEEEEESLYSLVCIMIGSILFPDSKTSPLIQRIRNSFSENGPKLREASRKTSLEILQWTRRGSPLRALLVITMGTIVLVTTMALVVFVLFFVAATANAIVISLLVSLAVAGGFLALFFSLPGCCLHRSFIRRCIRHLYRYSLSCCLRLDCFRLDWVFLCCVVGSKRKPELG